MFPSLHPQTGIFPNFRNFERTETIFRPLPSHDDVKLEESFAAARYGFSEPPLDKRQKNRLVFSETLEILRAKLEIKENPNKESVEVKNSIEFLKNSPVIF